MKKAYLLFIVFIPFLILWKADDINVYTVDISQATPSVISNHLKLGSNKSPSGDVLDANSLYFIKNGRPWFPVMGEIHFSRFPRAQWEESILKMKAAGIDVIASYVFWIYHEEEEGKFNWSGDNDLRAFAELCKKHDVYFFARIGPWCHGEVRNGGLPDWIIKRGNIRKNDSTYLASVKVFYNQIGEQLEGLYFKDGGAVIGTQIENEYRFNNPAGLEHMFTLKRMAIEAGIDVPFYSATGWPGSNQKQDELIPVWGAYPEAPWDKKTSKLALSENYLFGTLRNDPAIGSDLFGQDVQHTDYKGYRYPYATAEMGGGNQITYHRRPIIESDDVTALSYVKVGSGANLMGYYMFHGGSNPIGKLTTLQESKATKYPNDYPIISYDFLSPIGEWGQLRPSYKGFKVLHTFLNYFGHRLVQAYPSFPAKVPQSKADNSVLRMSVRSKDSSGFVFISNFQRQLEMKDIENVQFRFKLPGGKEIQFPKVPLTVEKNAQMVLPFNMDLDGLNLNYATAQPLCRLDLPEPVYVFFTPQGISSEFVFNSDQIAKSEVNDVTVAESDGISVFKITKPGTDCTIKLHLTDGTTVKLIVLTQQQALNSFTNKLNGKEHLLISDQEIIFNQETIRLQSTVGPELKFAIYPAVSALKSSSGIIQLTADGVFSAASVKLTQKQVKAQIKEVTNIAPYLNKGQALPEDDRLDPEDPASPGPQYQTNLKAVNGSKYYEIKLPQTALKGLSDAFIQLNYTGDTGAAYLDGKLIADDFYSGLPMTIGLKKFASAIPGKKMLFQIVPLTDERQIYFEDGIRDALKGKRVAELSAVRVIPQYEVTIYFGKN